MNDELTRLEAERARLLEITRSDERRMQITTNIMMFAAIGILGIVLVLFLSAVLAGQLSLTGFFWSSIAAGLLSFILSRKLRSGSREAMVADVVFGGAARPSENTYRAQIAEYDRRIASLKMGKNP